MAHYRPKSIRLKKKAGDELQDPHVHPLGGKLELEADGESGDPDNTNKQETSALVRLFYRVNGIPRVHILYNGRLQDGQGADQKDFKTYAAGFGVVYPTVIGNYSLSALAWDHKNKASTGDEIKLRVAKVAVKVKPAYT